MAPTLSISTGRYWITLIRIGIGYIRCFPHLILLAIHPNKGVIFYDLSRWRKMHDLPYSSITSFVYLMMHYREFRNVFYYRIGFLQAFVSFLCPKERTLCLSADEIGPGLFIYHGFASRLGTKSIGKD